MKSSVITVCVDAARVEAPGIRSYVISRVDGAPLDAYEPGAHINVAGPSGVTRQYSLCCDPDLREQHLFAVKREDASRSPLRAGLQIVGRKGADELVCTIAACFDACFEACFEGALAQ